jgi:pyridinium-3,5-biscarboxylic acid mononucleotide synthase
MPGQDSGPVDDATLKRLLDDVRAGVVDPDDAARRLRRLPFADLGFARVDHHRALRQRTGEAIYGPGKSPDQCARIVAELLDEGAGPVVLSRGDDAQVAACLAAAPGGAVTTAGGRSTVVWCPAPPRPGNILVVTAGTADLPVAEECRAVLVAFGFEPRVLADCGVAGIHRLLAEVDVLADADAVVVVAGMEGALASVVTGITGAPVIAVPTSTGYGAAFEGMTALLGMLAACASGLTVVGIDNGFGAACALSRLLP